jgi:phosphoribosyl 1,2-cyclic phosphate phosphodiesterase
VAVAERLQARQAWFTHVCHDLGHDATNRSLPDGMRLAHDGLQLRVEVA